MDLITPARLAPGGHLRVVAPSASRAVILEHDHREILETRWRELGLTVSFGAHVDERDAFDSSSIESRVADLHEAFADPAVDGILSVVGGYNVNELLPHLDWELIRVDWELIRAHPKIFCGYSDTTALQHALLARAGLVSYSGPSWSSFGMRDHFRQTFDWFRAGVFTNDPIRIRPAEFFTDDPWFLDQDHRYPVAADGWWSLQPGTATGPIVGGNLCTLNLLQGTGHLPSLDGALLFVEDDQETRIGNFARDLTSLLQLPDATGIVGLVIGRFQRESMVTRDLLAAVIDRQPALRGKPVLANADFGHTYPMFTFPIGGAARIRVAGPDESELVLRP